MGETIFACFPAGILCRMGASPSFLPDENIFSPFGRWMDILDK